MFIVGHSTLDKILNDIFYLVNHLHMSGEYIESLTPFEREYMVFKLIAQIKEHNEAIENNG